MENKDKYIQAGRIAAKVREESKKWLRVGTRAKEFCEKVEERIKELGGEPAFPVNVSVNDIAAHFTAGKDDNTMFQKDDVVKVDIGVHVDGYIGDTAYTKIFVEKYSKLVKCVEDALRNGLKACKVGAKICDISSAIENTIRSYGYNPIVNLTGHGLDRYVVHGEPQIPNVKTNVETVLKKGQVIAIEPFATPGNGKVKESGESCIFQLTGDKIVRNPDGRKIVEFAKPLKLPFAERWIPIESKIRTRLAIRDLINKGILIQYPMLREVSGNVVAQAEHTVLIDDKPIITTVTENDNCV